MKTITIMLKIVQLIVIFNYKKMAEKYVLLHLLQKIGCLATYFLFSYIHIIPFLKANGCLFAMARIYYGVVG